MFLLETTSAYPNSDYGYFFPCSPTFSNFPTQPSSTHIVVYALSYFFSTAVRHSDPSPISFFISTSSHPALQCCFIRPTKPSSCTLVGRPFHSISPYTPSSISIHLLIPSMTASNAENYFYPPLFILLQHICLRPLQSRTPITSSITKTAHIFAELHTPTLKLHYFNIYFQRNLAPSS